MKMGVLQATIICEAIAVQVQRLVFKVQCRHYELRDNVRRRWPEKAAQFVAWHLPHEVVKWCMVRIAALAWAGDEQPGPDQITYPLMCDAWDKHTHKGKYEPRL